MNKTSVRKRAYNPLTVNSVLLLYDKSVRLNSRHFKYTYFIFNYKNKMSYLIE